jgi:2'-5' RNA ligase
MEKIKLENKYSLWFMPEGNIYQKLSDLISQLSKKYSAPYFEPHITILHSLAMPEEEMIKKTSELAIRIHPFRIELTTTDYLDEYFRCFFVRAGKTVELINANLKAREIFNRKSDPKYMPHLSLLYGNFPSKIKEEIIEEIGREFDESFEIKSIHLFSSEEDIGKWHRIKEFYLR